LIWNNGLEEINQLGGTYNSPFCAGVARATAELLNDVNDDWQNIANASFDVQQYKGEDAKAKRDNAMKQLKKDQEALSSYRRILQKNCCKSAESK
jgi:hypothetical protein